MQRPPETQFRPSPSPSPSMRRALPDRNVTSASIEDGYVTFILYCNPGVPLDTDSAALREAFRNLPKSGGKTFSTFTLFELIKQLESKELKTWAELALKLGVDPPDQEKGQSSQKIQQYAVRLKRWMHSMHVDAFFEYLQNHPHPYWTETPSDQTPITDLERDGVAAEDDMALRALLPHIKPRRARHRMKGEDDSGKLASSRPSPQGEELAAGARNEESEPWTAHPDGRGSVFLFPVSDPSRLNTPMAEPPAPNWNGNDVAQTPLTAYPHSALTPNTRNAFWADLSEPKSAITPPPINPPAVNIPPAAPTVIPPTSAPPTPIQMVQSPVQYTPTSAGPSRPAKRSRLSLQVPERVGGEVRLATPPLPPPAVPPVVMVNGQTPQAQNGSGPHQQAGDPSTAGIFNQHVGGYAGGHIANPSGAPISHPRLFFQDRLDRTNKDELEGVFMYELLTASWYDAKGNRVPPCGVEEAWGLTQTVVDNLLKAAATKEAFLINLAALAGGNILMPKGSLRVTRLEELSDRTRYYSCWELRFGDMRGEYTMEETVMHDKWKKKPLQPDKDGRSTTVAAGEPAATTNGGMAEVEASADYWQNKYKEMARKLQQADKELTLLRHKTRIISIPQPRLSVSLCSAEDIDGDLQVNKRLLNSIIFLSISQADRLESSMPKQYVVCGRPVPRFGSRHLSLLLVVISLFAVFSLLFTLPSSVPGPNLQVAVNKSSSSHKWSIYSSFKSRTFKSPWIHKISPFSQKAHVPERQANDTYGETSWYSNFKWLSQPFSSSVTHDENRQVLPVAPRRPNIFCYFDNTVKKEKAEKQAESELLLAWRRAWWAQGFKPIILTPAEARNNPRYGELLKRVKMDSPLMEDFMRWLAWENMGGGILAHRLLFPMGAFDDPLLVFLRRAEFPALTRWKDLEDGLFVGPTKEITASIKLAMSSPHLKTAEDFLATLAAEKDENPFSIDTTKSKSLAYYSTSTLKSAYKNGGETITAPGLKNLTQLIESHLHLTWQNLFPSGIAVVKPLPYHTTHIISPAYRLATQLASCPDTPLPKSCPPNAPKCTQCSTTRPLKISTPAHYTNKSTLYTIGTVPHPYTTATLNFLQSSITIPWIRRKSSRDAWITSLTTTLFPDNVSGAPRILKFKEAVASETYAARSLWLLAEPAAQNEDGNNLMDDLDWHFGFALPAALKDVEVPPHDPRDGPVALPEELKLEPGLLERAQAIVGGGGSKKDRATKEERQVREAVEAWNLADAEAWRFARAYLARKTVERMGWEQKESKYAGGMGSDKGRRSGWDRWLD
ncbi:ARS binding protein 2-domain-containing protein [Podospora didyma]|uniref:ARS binding protein 2-domain-containing protein n=1 Tax=Podospora didyma TaxID=330526 RepID=A0AAE0U1H6_9PEZI|nr:ARS binding protein 2-domain-containing protein [Podospora didyma]